MRPGYTLSGKKIDPAKETNSFAKKILIALNMKAVRRSKPQGFYEGTVTDKTKNNRRKKTQAAKQARKTRGNK